MRGFYLIGGRRPPWTGSGRPPPRAPRARGPPPLGDGPRAGRQDELAVDRVHRDHVALADLALQDRERQAVDEELLHRALEWPGAVGRVVPEVAQERPGVVGELHLDPALAHPLG